MLVMWNGVTWKVVWCKIVWCDVMEWCVMWKRLTVVWSWVVWKAIWILLITNTTAALVMWNVAGTNTHTHREAMALNFTHTGQASSPEEKRWVLRADSNDATGDIYLLCVMWNVMLYDVECLWPGWTTVWSGAEWCGEEERMVWNGGVKLLCGVKCHGVIWNVLWYG